MSNINPDIEALAHVLATIESRRPEWGFSLDAALEYREEKWSRHIWEAQRLLEEMTPWLFEHDRQVAERAWDEAITHVERLSDPASTIYISSERELITLADVTQAREENPYTKENNA